jgi:hypothetical protein
LLINLKAHSPFRGPVIPVIEWWKMVWPVVP